MYVDAENSSRCMSLSEGSGFWRFLGNLVGCSMDAKCGVQFVWSFARRSRKNPLYLTSVSLHGNQHFPVLKLPKAWPNVPRWELQLFHSSAMLWNSPQWHIMACCVSWSRYSDSVNIHYVLRGSPNYSTSTSLLYHKAYKLCKLLWTPKDFYSLNPYLNSAENVKRLRNSKAP
ncbi:hypothetical protein BDV95DRAFT_670727 [Massariosphaeria phaeospora]|uniref:Uncharacterized protein n=1 Tax=Massariosphaeria phaeospora TaxID=100035 RepID=A0A7C8M5C1_9PLEO|nr:hypothetical protein BDV95DRAFT_670727 [Massariosphaeria phaeospora]